MYIIPCSCLQLTVCTSYLVVVYNTQPQTVTSKLVHVHVPTCQCIDLYCILQHAVYWFCWLCAPTCASYLEPGHHCLNSPTRSTKKNINILPNIDWVPFPLYFPCHVHALHQSSRPTNTSTVNGTSNSSYSQLIKLILQT